MKEYWYPWTPAKFKQDTMHLTDDQELIYRRLIDFYMETKAPLPDNDQALANIARVSFEKFLVCADAVKQFFNKCQATGKLQLKRCDGILADQAERSQSYSERGKKGGRGKINETNAPKATEKLKASTLHNKTVQVLLEKEPKGARAKPVPKPDDIPQQLWEDHLQYRKAKKQPMTKTALTGMRREAEGIGWTLEQALEHACGQGWASFKSEWVTKGNGNETTSRNNKPAYSKSAHGRQVLANELAESLRRDGQAGSGNPRFAGI